MRTNWKLVTTLTELRELVQYCQEERVASVDFETNGTAVHADWFFPTEMGVSFRPGSGWVIPLNHAESPFQDQWEAVLGEFCRGVIENPAVTKYVFNGLFEYRIFLRYGHRPRGRFFDVMLMKYLLHEERPNDLKSLVDMLLPEFAGYDLEGKPGKKAKPEAIRNFWENVPLAELSQYCAGDSDFTLRLGIHFENKLMNAGLYQLFRNFYMPLVRVLSDTVLKGVMVDREYLKGQVASFQGKIDTCLEEIFEIQDIADYNEDYIDEKVEDYIVELEREIKYEDLTDTQINLRETKIARIEAGDPVTKKEMKLFERINFASVLQMGKLFFTSDFGFEFPILARTDKGEPSTAEDVLLKLQSRDDSGFIKSLLELRGLQKLYSTYIRGIYDDHLTPEDNVHPGYLLHGTVTGRLSSRGPNFQNIPRTTTSRYIKKMFISPKDHFFIEMDLSQAELRYAAEVSRDKAMLQVFAEGKNIHVATAALMFEVDYDLVNKARKDETHEHHLDMVKKHKSAKVLNFTIFYGAGAKKVGEFLTERTGEFHSSSEAQDFIDKWFEAFPQASRWIKQERKKAIRDGEVQSIFGRKRRLAILNNPRNKDRERGSWNEALRQAVNAQIQGGSSDITQWINLKVYQAILEGRLPSYMRLVSTVHDSVEYYVHKDDLARVAPIMLNIARTLPMLKERLGAGLKLVPMKASLEYGLNWGTMYSYNPDKDKEKDFGTFYADEYKRLYT